jgi:hypothetical protein
MKFWTCRIALIVLSIFGALPADLIHFKSQSEFAAGEEIHPADRHVALINASDSWIVLPRERKLLPKAPLLLPWSEGLFLISDITDRLLTPPPNLCFKDLHQFYAVCRI